MNAIIVIDVNTIDAVKHKLTIRKKTSIIHGSAMDDSILGNTIKILNIEKSVLHISTIPYTETHMHPAIIIEAVQMKNIRST